MNTVNKITNHFNRIENNNSKVENSLEPKMDSEPQTPSNAQGCEKKRPIQSPDNAETSVHKVLRDDEVNLLSL